MRVRKKVFLPWQKYVSNLTFMYQGILIFLSSLVACSSFYLLTSLFLNLKDTRFVTVISNGEMVTRLASPLFLLAIVFAGLLIVLFLLSTPIAKLLLKLFSEEKEEGNDTESTKPLNVKRRICMSFVHAYAFSITIFLLFLYVAAVFSLMLKNGTIEYLFIFVSLAILTFMGKSIVAYPVYCAMFKVMNAERRRRDSEALVANRDEGEEPVSVCRLTLTRDNYPRIYACADRAAGALKYKVEQIEVVLGSEIADVSEIEGTRSVKLSIGCVLFGILSEEELEAMLTSFFVGLYNGSPKILGRFIKLNEAYSFCLSNWNPIDRFYFPIIQLLVTECRQCITAVRKSVIGSVERYFVAAGEEKATLFASASLKKAVYVFIPFAYGKDFYHPLLKGEAPVPDYYTRLKSRYFSYLEKNFDHARTAVLALAEKNKILSEFFSGNLLAILKDKNELSVKRPSGEYADECSLLSAFFDRSFALLSEPAYENRSEKLYKSKVRRITEFEKELLSGKEKSVDEKVQIAEDYLSIMMHEAAADLLSDVSDYQFTVNSRLNLVNGEALLRGGDIRGLDMLEKAASLNYRCVPQAIRTAERLLVAIGRLDKYDGLSERFKSPYVEYVSKSPSLTDLFFMEDLTGNYKASQNVSPCTSFDDEEKNRIASALVDVCGEDRLEWAALVNVKTKAANVPTLIVRCSDIHPGGYTDTYCDGVYFATADRLEAEIRSFGDNYERELVARLLNDAEIEAFEDIEGAIICRKGSLVAKKILSRELSSFLSEDGDGYAELEADEPCPEDNGEETENTADGEENKENKKIEDKTEEK